ncbi:flagellar basal body rod protein FlgB [Cupriavidus cauae]|uniref:Flagellar basal body rod protein FlgB n=1 Tax=Cupriavidus cauae TaxID=2608999 RepID=A0A5M8A5Q7_9BURK|nr:MULTISPECIES: flagellar basal body rod protein FlgB [Cupriavidus]KAA0179306.1 flagellar basal body rod protein FlgB [Cupriavidus gilardii]KAA6118022.1 flagellar basal body rod protein FlgB [Cupriavidus cauae]MCA7086513.1 flagellar basal body rod protein FlgB [Cupriavidus sp. DB3]UZN52154.1 flagellar basal body rod protein FlgB [Cupriavidus cauae]
MIDRLDASFRFQQEALNLRNQRQSVIAANIANADTPGFKARDFDFASQLSESVERGRQANGVSLSTTSTRHLPGQASVASEFELAYRIPMQSSIDGNTVEMDTERVAFADNAVKYEFGLTVMNAKIKGMLSAIQS